MITSKDNKLIKFCTQLKEKKFSRTNGLCFVETFKIINELKKKNLITQIFVIENKFDLVKNFNTQTYIISESVCKYLSDAKSSDGIFAIAKIPEKKFDKLDHCLILDNIQDPSNLGAIIRSACAFGYNTIFAINSVYPYSYKCIRSSMGYIFDVNFIETDYDNLLQIKQSYDLEFVCSDMNGVDIKTVSKLNKKFAVIIGNEGQGVSDKLTNISDIIISIPMNNNVESLNASVSAGIIMYLLK